MTHGNEDSSESVDGENSHECDLGRQSGPEKPIDESEKIWVERLVQVEQPAPIAEVVADIFASGRDDVGDTEADAEGEEGRREFFGGRLVLPPASLDQHGQDEHVEGHGDGEDGQVGHLLHAGFERRAEHLASRSG